MNPEAILIGVAKLAVCKKSVNDPERPGEVRYEDSDCPELGVGAGGFAEYLGLPPALVLVQASADYAAGVPGSVTSPATATRGADE